MKLLKLIPTLSLFILSCSTNDNDNDNPPTPTLIAKWNLDKRSFNSSNQTLSICQKQKYIQFNSNGTFERKDYYLNGTNCELEGYDTGSYSYNSSNSKITLSFTDPDDGPQTETLNNVVFDNSTLKYSWDENTDGTDEWNLEYKK